MLGGNCEHSCCPNGDVYRGGTSVDGAFHPNFPKATLAQYMRRGYGRSSLDTPANNVFRDSVGYFIHAADGFAVDSDGVAYWSREVTALDIHIAFRPPNEDNAFSSPSNYDYSINPGPSHYVPCPFLAFDRWQAVYARFGLTQSGRIVAWDSANELLRHEGVVDPQFWTHELEPGPLESIETDMGLLKNFIVEKPPFVQFAEDPSEVARASFGFVLSGWVQQIDLTSSGSGYDSVPTVRLEGGGGTGATARAVINNSGQVAHILVTSSGSGYSSPPAVIIDPPAEGQQATATAVNLSTVKEILITSPGLYKESPRFVARRASDDRAIAILMASSQAVQESDFGADYFSFSATKSATAIAPRTDITATVRRQVSDYISGAASSGTSFLRGSEDSSYQDYTDSFASFGSAFANNIGTSVISPHYLYDQSVSGASRDTEIIPRGKCTRGYTYRGLRNIVGFVLSSTMPTLKATYWSGHGNNTNLPQPSFIPVPPGGDIFTDWKSEANRLDSLFYRDLSVIGASGRIGSVSRPSGTSNLWCVTLDTSGLEGLLEHYVDAHIVFENHFDAYDGEPQFPQVGYTGYSKVNCLRVIFFCSPQWKEEPGAYRLVWEDNPTKPTNVVELSYEIDSSGIVNTDVSQSGYLFHDLGQAGRLRTNRVLPAYLPGLWKEVHSISRNDFQAVSINGDVYKFWPYPISRVSQTVDWAACDEITFEDYALGTDAILDIGFYGPAGDYDIQIEQRRTTTTRTLYHLLSRSPSWSYRHPASSTSAFAEDVLFNDIWFSRSSDGSLLPSQQTYGVHLFQFGSADGQAGVFRESYAPISSVSVMKSRPFPRNGFIPGVETHFVGGRSLRPLAPYDPRNPVTEDWYVPESQQQRLFFDAPMKVVSSIGDAESSIGRHIIESGTGRLFSLAFTSPTIVSRQRFYEYVRVPGVFEYETIAHPGSGLSRISDVRGRPNAIGSLQSRVLGVPFSGQVTGSVAYEVSPLLSISTIPAQFQDRLNNEENARFLAILPTSTTATYYHPVNYVNIINTGSVHDGAIGPIHVADNASNLVAQTNSRLNGGIFTSSGWLLDSSSRAYPWVTPLAPIFSYRGLLGAAAGKNAILFQSSAGSGYSAMLHADITEGYAGDGYTQPARPAIGNEYSNPSTPTGDYPYDSCLREKYTVTGPGGFVAGCSVVKPGSKFRSPPSVSISGGGGSGASAVAHTQGPIESFEVVNSGSGYTHPPELVFSGNGIHPDPKSIAITLNESGGIDSVTFNQSSAGGTEYFPSDLAIDDINTQTSPGFLGSYSPSHPYPRGLYQNPPTISVSPSPVLDSISVTSGGQHYQSPPRVIINSETGKGADAVANISGPVSLITVTSEGSGYAYPPLVRCYLQTSSPDADFVDAVPSTDSFAASLVDGRVVSVAITGDGGSLHAPPQVEFINLLGVASVEIQNGGEGYDPENPPVVSLDEAASAEDAVLTPVIEDGVLVSVTVESSGGGYSGDNPSVTIDPPPSGGVQATAEAFFSPTPGSGAAATSRINGSVYSCPVLQSGYGYRDAEVLFIDGSGGFGGGSRATGVANFATGSGSGAEINCLIDGRLLYIEMTSGGSGYSSSPEVLLSPANGAECQSKILYRSGDYSASKTQSEYWGGLLRDAHLNSVWDTSDETGYRCLGNFLTPIKWLTPDGTEVFDERKGNFNGYEYALPTIKHTTSESDPIPPGFYMHDPPRVESNSIGTYVFPATSLEESGFFFCKEIFGSEWFFGQSFISQPTEQERSYLYKTNIATLFEYGDARFVFEVSHLPSNLELSFNPGEVNLSLATTSGKLRNQPQFSTSDSSYFPASQISWYFPSGSSLDVTTQDVEAAPALGAISGSSPTRSVSWSSSGGGKFRTTTTTQTLSLPAGSWLKKPSANITISQDGVVESVSLTNRGELFPGESLGEIVVQGTGSGCIIAPKIARRVSAVTMNILEGRLRSFGESGPESTPIGSTQDFIDGAKRTDAKFNTYAGTVGATVVFFGGGEIEPASAVVSSYGIEVTSPGLYAGTPEAYLVANGVHIPVSVLMGRESVIYDLDLQSGGRGYSQDSVVYFRKSVAINKFYSHRSFEELSKRNTDYGSTGSGGTFKTDPCGLVWQQKSSFTPQFVIHKDWLSSQDDITETRHKTQVNIFFENDWSVKYYNYVASFGLEASLLAAVLTTYQNGFVTGCLVAHPGQSPGGTAAYNTPDDPNMNRFLFFSAYRSRTGPSSYLLYYVQKSRNGDWVTQTRFPINFSPHSNTNFWNAGMGEGMIAFPGECSSRAAAKSKIFNWYATGRNHLVRK